MVHLLVTSNSVKYEIVTKVIDCHFHNCHFRNGVCCGNDMQPSNNRILSLFLRDFQCMMDIRLFILSIPVGVYCPMPIIWMLIVLSYP